MKLSSKLKWILGGLAGAVCLSGWVSIGLVLLFHKTVPALTAACTFTGLATEGFIWTMAAILGVTVLESRKRIGAFLMRPFARRA